MVTRLRFSGDYARIDNQRVVFISSLCEIERVSLFTSRS